MTADPERDPIDVLADDVVARLRQGERPTVEEYAERNPELASAIRELLPTVIAMEDLKRSKEGSDRSRFLRGPGALTRLGDFLILGEIGRGGMGIVYEAMQESLDRHVAVKVLPRQSLLDANRLARFQREAQTAARLHHTNIVPIFGVGEQDGYHYYVMQFIRGAGLDQVLRALRGEPQKARSGSDSRSRLVEAAATALRQGRFPQPARAGDEAVPDRAAGSGSGQGYWRSVARIGVQVADALSYAHSQDTLHRDIKPANLLLDASGVAWVTDFGLAKAIEDSHLTQSGDIVGTLQYMAPEQVHGQYDARSDIYCLGLTLYELLALQPAFADGNRSGLLQQVTAGRVAAPRRIRPDIPADLETIVLKAISADAKHRYQTAADLREDLSRFLEDRPILARRTTPVQHVWRWCRRNQAMAATLAVAVLVVLGLGFTGWAFALRARTESAQARRAEQLAEKNLNLAMQAFEDVFDQVAGPDVFQLVVRGSTGTIASTDADEEPETWQDLTIPTVSEKDAALLQKILEFYNEFAVVNAGNAGLREDTARAQHRIGDLYLRLGKLVEARSAYERAIDRYRELDPASFAVPIATIQNQLGQVFAQDGRVADARRAHRAVVAALGGEPRTGDARALYELARAHDFLGTVDRPPPGGMRGPPGRGAFLGDRQRRTHHEQAQALLDELVARTPNNLAVRLAKARSCRNYFGFLTHGPPDRARRSDDETLARRLVDAAIAILEDLAREHPEIQNLQYELALARSDRGSFDGASLQQALEMVRALHAAEPSVPAYAESLGEVLLRTARHRRELMLPFYHQTREAVTVLEALVAARPDNRSFALQLVRARVEFATALVPDEPFAALAQIDLAMAEVDRHLAGAGEPRELWRLVEAKARVLEQIGLRDEARQLLQRLRRR